MCPTPSYNLWCSWTGKTLAVSHLGALVDVVVLSTVETLYGHPAQPPLLLLHKSVHPEGLRVNLLKPEWPG